MLFNAVKPAPETFNFKVVMEDQKSTIVYGINPILEAMDAGKRRCYKIHIKEGKLNARIQSILKLAAAAGVKVETLPKQLFQQKYGAYAHQSIIGHFSSIAAMEINDLVRRAFAETAHPALVLADEIQDPQNLGAMIRSAEVLGIQGLILPERRSAPLNEAVAKCSAGAVERLPLASVPNLANAVEFLKQAGFWIVGVEAGGKTPCHEFQFDLPVALIIGGEEKGIRPLLRKKCDFTLSIPMEGKLNSLNAAAASAVVFYEILRQKKERKKLAGPTTENAHKKSGEKL